MNTNVPQNRRAKRTKTGIRQGLARWVYGLFFVALSIPSVLASADYSYVFTANPGQVTWYNGTTIEIQVTPGLPGNIPPPDLFYQIVSLDFHGALDLPATAGDPPYYGPSPGSLTPFSFSLSAIGLYQDFVSIGSANASSWSGGFNGFGGPNLPIDPVSGSYLITSSEVFWDIESGGTGQPIILQSATGTWSFVPDGGSSFELLAAALAALAAGRLLLRRPGDYGKS